MHGCMPAATVRIDIERYPSGAKADEFRRTAFISSPILVDGSKSVRRNQQHLQDKPVWQEEVCGWKQAQCAVDHSVVSRGENVLGRYLRGGTGC